MTAPPAMPFDPPQSTATGPRRPRDGAAVRRAFRGCGSGIAAVEFALVAPFLLVLLLAGAETSRFVVVTSRLTQIASTEAGLLAARTATDGPASTDDLLFVQSAATVIFPRLLSETVGRAGGWQADIGLTLSSVVFSPTAAGCTSNCTYTAKVLFSWGSRARPCLVTLSSAPDAAAPSTTTLPTDVFTSGSLVVADVVYTYVPLFGSGLVPTLTLRRSAYVQPRYVAVVEGPYACPGA